ncbi:harmonin-binding protein USHBP1 isoform X2 [Sorex araneus]|uniref:harmonin-binding protein USHBP1 isoform X2 n=1 Tax=Sorex araneus TaxID=42254 RepID=UPI002433DDCB|nr:harmonin-binding protein USHBP1 isoform X2 [Sorex araneus]
MSARATRPRSRRGRHALPGELDPVVESSEETEVASRSTGPGAGPATDLAQEVKPELQGMDLEPPLGHSPRGSVHAEADEDGGKVSLELAEPASQTPQAPQAGEPPGPTDVFEKLQDVLCSLEATATAWRVQPQPQQAEGGGPGTGMPAMEPEAGPGGLQREAAGLAERNAWLRLALESREAELARMQAEKETVQREVQELQNFLLTLEPAQPLGQGQGPSSRSEPGSPGAEPWGTRDTPFPLAQPLLRRLRSDPSTQLLVTPCSVPESHAMEVQLEQLRGSIEKLKCFNRLLSAVLQGCKGRCEALSMQLGQREAEATVLRLALQDSESCERAYGSLLVLRAAASPRELEVAEQEAQRLLAQDGDMWQGSLPSPEGSSVDRPTTLEVAAQLQGWIQCLQKHRALLKIPPEPGPTLTPVSTVPRAEAMVQAILDTQPGPALPQLDKIQIQQDLAATRESLADLMLRLQLVRREKRGLELREAAMRAQSPAHALLQAQLRWELELLQTGCSGSSSGDTSGAGSSSEDDEEGVTLHPPAVPAGSQSLDGGWVSQEQDQEKLAQELAASLTRALDLQEQLQALREELEQVVQKGRARRVQSAELTRELCKAHSSLVLAFRGAHRKQEEQRRKLEQQVAMMEARHTEELLGLEAVARALGRPPRPLPSRLPRPGETFL